MLVGVNVERIKKANKPRLRTIRTQKMAIGHYALLDGRFSKYVGPGCALKTCYAIL
jgi:hypothetical protein